MPGSPRSMNAMSIGMPVSVCHPVSPDDAAWISNRIAGSPYSSGDCAIEFSIPSRAWRVNWSSSTIRMRSGGRDAPGDGRDAGGGVLGPAWLLGSACLTSSIDISNVASDIERG